MNHIQDKALGGGGGGGVNVIVLILFGGAYREVQGRRCVGKVDNGG